MNGNWQSITQQHDIKAVLTQVLAQTSPLVAPEEAARNTWSGITQGFNTALGPSLLNLLSAIAILLVGWIIASLAASIVKGVLNRTSVDNRLASWMTGRPATGRDAIPVEKWIASAVYWLVIIFTLVAVLQALQLSAVSVPLNNFLSQIIGFLPKIVGAAVILAVAWGIATIVKMIAARSLHAFGLDRRLGDSVGNTATEGTAPNQLSLSDTLANSLYWLVFLFFLPSILNTLGLQGTLQPVQQLLNQILSVLPNILGAVLIGLVGWLVAQVVRQIVTNLLSAAGVDQFGRRFGLSGTRGGQSLSWIIGTFVYVFTLIPTAIAALNQLQINAISQPAIAMLQQILNAIPAIFTAGLILVLAYFLGKFVADLVTSILTSIGFNNIFSVLGLQSLHRQTVVDTEPVAASRTTRTPSEVVGIIVLVGIILFGAVAAVNILNIQALTVLVTGILVVLGRILAGLIVFAIGLFLANLAFSIITSSGDSQAMILGQVARIAIIALVSAMALQQIGIASDIVNLAFGLLLGALAVAAALAFGLGGRDIAAQEIRHWLDSFKSKRG